MGKKSGSGSGMNNPDHISKSFGQVFLVKINSLMRIRDPGRKKFESGIRDEKKFPKIWIRDIRLGSATLHFYVGTVVK